jgi:hypothetical protein
LPLAREGGVIPKDIKRTTISDVENSPCIPQI